MTLPQTLSDEPEFKTTTRTASRTTRTTDQSIKSTRVPVSQQSSGLLVSPIEAARVIHVHEPSFVIIDMHSQYLGDCGNAGAADRAAGVRASGVTGSASGERSFRLDVFVGHSRREYEKPQSG